MRLPVVVSLTVLLSCSGSSTESLAVCGDGVAAGAEDCDKNNLRGRRCANLGFNAGALTCRADCAYDLGGCTVVELCGNGVNDDGDGDKDCDDASCADDPACAVCGDGRVNGGETCDDGNQAPGDCCDRCRAEAGCEVEDNAQPSHASPVSPPAVVRGNVAPTGDVDVFVLTVPAGSTGTVTAEVSDPTDGDLCFGAIDSRVEIVGGDGRVVGADEDSGAGTCSRARNAGLAPGSAFVRVAAGAFAAVNVFPYRLSVSLALSPCGDGVVQEGQECDDANAAGGDGCSAACRLEDSAEVEPNDGQDQAGAARRPPFAVAGAIDQPLMGNADHDWFAVEVVDAGRLSVQTSIVEPETCGGKLVTATLFAPDGTSLGTTGSGGADPRDCGSVLVTVAPGRHLLRVSSRPSPGRYRLVVTPAAP